MGAENKRARIARADCTNGHIRLGFEGAPIESADFHAFWLRHQCPCCRHVSTGERTLCPSRVPLDIRVLAAHPIEDGPTAMLRIGAITSAEPNPAKPRIVPPDSAAAITSAASHGVSPRPVSG